MFTNEVYLKMDHCLFIRREITDMWYYCKFVIVGVHVNYILFTKIFSVFFQHGSQERPEQEAQREKGFHP